MVRQRTADGQCQRIGRTDGDPIAHIGEDGQRVELVIAVGPPPENMESEVDLRRRKPFNSGPRRSGRAHP
jgi:hypothetical protein